jgi:hypothetical protein
MTDLKELIQTIAEQEGIDPKDGLFKATELIVGRDWFGAKHDVRDGKVLVDETSAKIIESSVRDYFKSLGNSDKENLERLERSGSSLFPSTIKDFNSFCSSLEIETSPACKIMDFMLYYLPGELVDSTDEEVGDLVDDAVNSMQKVYAQIWVDFINWTRQYRRTLYSSVYQLKDKTTDVSGKEAYALTEYLEMLYKLYNTDYIEDNDMYEQAAEDKNYADTWLFLSLHFISALRKTDLIRIPHPELPIEPGEVLKQVREGSFPAKYAELCADSVTWKMKAKLLDPPNKTKRAQGVGSIKLFIPESARIHLGTLFAVAEAHHQLSGSSQEDPLIRPIQTYEQITRYMGDDIGNMFLHHDFSPRAANKSYLQLIRKYTDDILDSFDEFKVNGYLLASLARSHKGTFGEFAKATTEYLKDANMSGMTPEFVGKELFERGVLSSIPAMLLKMVTNGAYDKLSVGQQTQLINELDMTPLEVETAVKATDSIYKRSREMAVRIYQSTSRGDILKILHRIGNGQAYAKQDYCLCLKTAMRQRCPYRSRKACVGCEYEIGTKALLLQMLNEYQRLNRLYHTTNRAYMKAKYEKILKEVLLPAINEMLTCLKEQYGEESVITLKEMIKEKINAK